MKSNCLISISFCCCLQRSCHRELEWSGTGIVGSGVSISGIPSQVTDHKISQSGSANPKSISVCGLSLASMTLSMVRYPVITASIAFAILLTWFQTNASPTISKPIMRPSFTQGLQSSTTRVVVRPGSLLQKLDQSCSPLNSEHSSAKSSNSGSNHPSIHSILYLYVRYNALRGAPIICNLPCVN